MNIPETYNFIKARSDWFDCGERARPALDAALVALRARGIDPEAVVEAFPPYNHHMA